MKQNLIHFSSLLLVISLLAGAANATGDANNTNESGLPDESNINSTLTDVIYPNGPSSGNGTSSDDGNLPETGVL